MATVKVVDLINTAQTTLLDPSGVRWTKLELLGYLNEGHREVVVLRPDAKVANEVFVCAASSKQTLPTSGLRLLDVVRNYLGQSIRQIDREVLDNLMPNWHEYPTAGTTTVEHYVYNPLDPKVFYLFPRPTNLARVEIIYSVCPPPITSTQSTLSDLATTTIGLDDVYANALLNYVLYRAYAKDADFNPNAQKAMTYLQAFQQALGVKTQIDVATTPAADPVKPA